ncbi:MAG: rod shape-determining protein MreD [Ignavibacteriales bacterium]|nr:rod shape-determining protein MreD [Ignavibacteriales bacterium]
MSNYLKPILYFIPLLLIQLVVVPLISVFGTVPNVIFIMVIYYLLLGGQIYGMILGFLAGFFFDLFSGGVLGASMLSMTIASFIAGYFYNENRVDTNTTSYFFLVILFIAEFINSLIYSFAGNFNPEVRFTSLLLEGALLPAVYTTIFGLGVVAFKMRKGKI